MLHKSRRLPPNLRRLRRRLSRRRAPRPPCPRRWDSTRARRAAPTRVTPRLSDSPPPAPSQKLLSKALPALQLSIGVLYSSWPRNLHSHRMRVCATVPMSVSLPLVRACGLSCVGVLCAAPAQRATRARRSATASAPPSLQGSIAIDASVAHAVFARKHSIRRPPRARHLRARPRRLPRRTPPRRLAHLPTPRQLPQ